MPIDILFDMVRKMTPAQLRAAVNRAQRQQKQAVDKYSREVRRYNAAAKKAVNDYNREVRTYNAKARTHNAEVRNQRRRLDQEIRRLNSRPATRTFVTYRSSVETLARTYTETEEDPTEDELRGPSMQADLAAFGQDLVDRWTGALFSLSPSNPDAARHFCTSAREVLIAMIDGAAPDSRVAEADPACARTDKGVPTRRAKVGFLLRRKGIDEGFIEDLVEEDIDNVLGLFHRLHPLSLRGLNFNSARGAGWLDSAPRCAVSVSAGHMIVLVSRTLSGVAGTH